MAEAVEIGLVWPRGPLGTHTQVVLSLGIVLTPHLQFDWGGRVFLPSSRRVSAFPGSGIFSPSAHPQPQPSPPSWRSCASEGPKP